MPEVRINELIGKNGKISSTPISLTENGNNGNENGRGMIVDSHEPMDIVEKLRQKGIPVEVERLASGDYIFSNIGIERKTLTDFWGSLTARDKRIWRQMFELKRNFERPFLVIEKFNFSFLRSPSYSKNIWGSLARISMLGINVVTIVSKSGGSPDFIDFIYYLYFSSDKSKKTYKPLPRKSEDPKEVFRDSLCMIPGIGPVTAKKILARHKSFEDLCGATKEDLSSLCGKSKVVFLWKILHGENP